VSFQPKVSWNKYYAFMFSTFAKHSALRWFSAFFLLMLFASHAWAGSTTVVISQVYGAGGNNGAVQNSDFVELFNLSASPVSLNGYAIQYASATQTAVSATNVFALPNITLQPGQRFLVAGTPGANGTAIPSTPDLIESNMALAAGAGKVYLTSSTTALTTVCPGSGGSIVDFVGYGTTASCFEGSAAAPAPSTTVADIRAGGGCTDTDQNGTDFSTGTPAPRNSSSAPTPCTVVTSSPISISATANPLSVYQGSSTLLTAAVTPGTNPASTSLAVTANLSAFSGSATQQLFDDGTHGDVTANDGTYSYTLTVPTSAPLGPNTIVVSASDSQLRTASANIAITVLAPVTLVPIHTIQGNVPGTAAYNGQTVMTSGIVTGVVANGFYLQAKDADADTDPSTPEGIFVHTGTGLVPTTATVGTNLELTGTVALFPTTSTIPGTELDNPTAYNVLSTGNALPTAITLTTTNPSPSGGFSQLQRYQSMRVAVPSFTVTGPTGGTLTETAETYVSNGQFWGTVTGDTRPVREPGLEVLDPSTATRPSTIPRFDDNPELFEVDSLAMQPSPGPLDLATGAVLTTLTGVMDFSGGAPLFIIDATSRPTATGGMTVVPVSGPKAGELAIGDQNLERFYDVAKETTGAIAVTPAAYALRLAKASLEIRNVMLTPDIIAVEEMENLQTLTALSTQISTDAQAAAQTDPQYAAYLVNGNDTSGINVGFLVNPSKITVTDVTQVGKTTDETGTTTLLNDRPPLVLRAGIKRPGGPDYPLTIIVNHLRSLNGVTDDTSSDSNARNKREQQAEFLANLAQQHQAAGEHVVVLGDLNTFEFNDGLVDSFGIIKGSAAPANQDVLAGTAGLVTPNLVDAAPTNIATNTYTYNFNGNAQSIDHVLTTQDIAGITRTVPVHVNADFPSIDRNNATIPQVGSDHDGIVVYIKVPGTTVLSFNPTALTFTTPQVLKTTATLPVAITNNGTAAITLTSIVASANFSIPASPCGASLAGGATCTITVSFTPTTTGPITGTLTFTDSDVTGTQTLALSGTGAGIFSATTLLPTNTSVVAGANVTLTATVTGNAGSTPTGTVNFLDGTTSLQSGVALNSSGTATFSSKTLAVATHSITAVYSGDANYPTSTSAAATVIVAPAPVADFTFNIANGQLLATSGANTASTILTVTLVNGFNTPVTFACSGLPAATRCAFSPATLTASGNTTLTVTIDTVATVHAPFNFGAAGGVMACGLLALPFFLRRKTRTALRNVATLAVLLLLTGGLAAITGCSGGSSSTPVGSSTVTVTATAGSVTHTGTFTLKVQ
jgi:predicted extracellular nuclease